jgi:hypothetical protein
MHKGSIGLAGQGQARKHHVMAILTMSLSDLAISTLAMSTMR